MRSGLASPHSRKVAGVVATVVLTIVGLIAAREQRHRDEKEFMAAFHALKYRPFDARLSGQPYAARPAPANDDHGRGAVAELRLKEFAARLSVLSNDDELRGRAALIAGNTERAKRQYEEITSRGNTPAAVWSDYAAILHAGAGGDVLPLLASISAANRALEIDPRLPAALFNRAIALEALSLRIPAARAYRQYLDVDASSPWASEAKERERLLNERQTARARAPADHEWSGRDELALNDIATAFPEEARRVAENRLLRQWGERVLNGDAAGAAAALAACRVIGRTLEKQNGESLVADSVRTIDSAGDTKALAQAHATQSASPQGAERIFKTSRSAMALAARKASAQKLVLAGHAAADAVLRDLQDETPARYRALHAEIRWLRALTALRKGAHREALNHLRDAHATFTVLGEEQNAMRVQTLIAGEFVRSRR